MLNCPIETKQEYTIQLINVLTPLIYEGLQSIYQEVVKVSTCDNILKNFQTFMQRIPKWNNDIIHNETLRIMNNSKSYSWLEDLIKATLKANIIVLTYNPTVKNQIKIDPSLYQRINIDSFIHKIYIECARELWNNPYLFYHQYSPIELKRNQRDSIILIKDCIKEGIRKLLPVKYILQIYLGEEMETELPDNNFEKCVSEVESRNLNKLIQKDLYQENNNQQKIYHMSGGFKQIEFTNSPEKNISNIEETNTVGSKILGIINNNDIKLTENSNSEDNLIDNKVNDALNDLKNKSETSDNNISQNNTNINKIINNIDETDTSIYNTKNDKFQEVFSNSNTKENINTKEDTNNLKPFLPENNINKTKEKFFANYLNL
jgi:hypothetical protein